MDGLVFNASAAADFANNQLGKYTPLRNTAYEAEFLLYMLSKPKAGFQPNVWQTETLNRMPKGLDSLPAEARYKLRPFQEHDFDQYYKG